MAEEHPPSPEREEIFFAREIAGQARYEGLGMSMVFLCWLLPEDTA